MKRKFVTVVLSFAVILSLAALAQTGSAAPTPATASAPSATSNKVGIINIQSAIVATNEGRRDLQALEKKFESKRAELQTLGKEVEDLKKQLTTQGDKLNEEARANLVRSLESKQKSLQRTGEDAQKEYQDQQSEIANRILQKLAPVIEKYAKDNDYSLLIDVSQPWPQGQVIWAGASADVTRHIVDIYNAQSGIAAPAAAGSASSAKPASGTAAPKKTTSPPATTTPPKK